MRLKTTEIDGNTYALVQDGKPVYTVDGQDQGYDVPGMHAKIGQLNGEAKQKREALQAANSKLELYGDITPEAAKDAVEKLSGIDLSKMVDNGKLEEVKQQINATWEQKHSAVVADHDALKARFSDTMLAAAFAGSKYIADNMAIPPDVAKAYFGSRFSIEDGKAVAKDASGNQIFSATNPGENATFDEAIKILVEQNPNRDQLLKATRQSGSGGGGSSESVSQSKTRDQFSSMSPVEQQAFAKQVREGKAELVD